MRRRRLRGDGPRLMRSTILAEARRALRRVSAETAFSSEGRALARPRIEAGAEGCGQASQLSAPRTVHSALDMAPIELRSSGSAICMGRAPSLGLELGPPPPSPAGKQTAVAIRVALPDVPLPAVAKRDERRVEIQPRSLFRRITRRYVRKAVPEEDGAVTTLAKLTPVRRRNDLNTNRQHSLQPIQWWTDRAPGVGHAPLDADRAPVAQFPPRGPARRRDDEAAYLAASTRTCHAELGWEGSGDAEAR